MIYFLADDHYGVHPGKNIFENLPSELQNNITFVENDWTLLQSGEWLKDCELLILNMIGTTCNLPHPDKNAEKAIKTWCEKGGNMLLLHGSSAAFWQWDWWRKIVGYRWVRPNDPDGVPNSTHPVKPYRLRVTKNRHPLSSKLIPFDLDTDEIYTELEQVSPAMVLMDTFIEEGVFPQCLETIAPWGGKFVSFIPGHHIHATANKKLIANITEITKYLLKK
ncbi:MAG: ThuA domain-containing protein [Lentisphaeria bacterium]|nr:ThuA domain-containing protein [Lentisphaeria bacterium]